MTRIGGIAAAGLAAGLALAVAASGTAWAQAAKKQASPFAGFSSDSGKPVDIKSDALEVHQAEQKAIFQGNVVATQGESTLKSATLTVFYDNAQSGNGAGGGGDKPAAAPAAGAEAAPAQGNSIKRLEAAGGVTVTAQDQKATGQTGVFDMASNTATLNGDVVLTQGPNVIRGKQLVVDLKTGVAHVLGGTTGLFVPSSQKGAGTKAP